ncbi:MAG: aminotransferase class I/II-fold pyridoxal phosphate-dependent enzyme [Desulfovibrio sp.]|uniref:DegT/DnrJ/EryC1/StrS family aminotransferase n=1 Tax=Desulfovibrio sp. TaxID=885 RepID=UPI0039E60A9A
MIIDPIIPNGPSITHHEIEHVTSACATGWNMRASSYINAFRQLMAQITGHKYALALSSCTGAMHVALNALGIKQGDEVLVPDLADFSVAACVVYCGATPIFCDVEPDTLCLSPEDAACKITPRTKGLIAVHLYGQPCSMEPLLDLANKKGLFVLEDAAQGIGSSINGRPAGSLGHFSTFSFKGNKSVVSGEGGILLTSDDQLFDRAARLAAGGRTSDNPFSYDFVGFNYSISSLQAALGFAQTSRLDELITKKKQIHSWYRERLSGTPGIRLNTEAQHSQPSFLTNLLFIDEPNIQRTKMISQLRASNIIAEPVYFPISSMPMFKQAETPVAYAASTKAICLPSGHNRTEEEVDYICRAIQQFVKEPGRDKAKVPLTGWLKYKSDTLEFFTRIKKEGFIIPFEHEGHSCELRMVTSADTQDAKVVETLARWREASAAAFLTRTEITEQTMQQILNNYVSALRDYLLFFIFSDGYLYGQVALNDFAFQKHECCIDGLYLEDHAPKGLAAASCETIFEWAEKSLEIKNIFNHVVASNKKVRLLAAAQGFREISRTALYREEIPGGETFRPMYMPGHDTPDEYLLICKKSLSGKEMHDNK